MEQQMEALRTQFAAQMAEQQAIITAMQTKLEENHRELDEFKSKS
jgi:hypothetical protein